MRRTPGGRSNGPLAALLGAALVACLLIAPAAASASSDAQASIIGGRSATIEEFPSLAYIEAQEGKSGFACTGTVASPRVILTAAHCVEDIERGRFTGAAHYAVATGTTSPGKALRANVFGVAETHVFPGFDPGSLRGDAAILVLDRPTSAPPIALAGAGDAALYAGGAALQLAGWGLTAAKATRGPETLRATTLVVQTPNFCKRKTQRYYTVFSTTNQFCALDAPSKRSGGCFGDSGGPGIGQRPDGTPVELGIISTGGPFCNTKFPNVLTRVDTVSTWVSEWIAATEAGGPKPVVDPNAPLPQMTKPVAETFAAYTLEANFRRAFERAKEILGNCRRSGGGNFGCEVVWQSGGNLYAGTVSPFYVRRQDATSWDSHFRIEWAPLKCLRSNPSRCRIHVRRG